MCLSCVVEWGVGVCRCVGVRVQVYVCRFDDMHTHVHAHIHVCLLCVCVCACVCVRVCVCVWQLGNSVRYWADTPGAMCVEGGAVAEMCTSGTALSANKLVKNLFIAKILPGEEVGEWKEISKVEHSQNSASCSLCYRKGL